MRADADKLWEPHLDFPDTGPGLGLQARDSSRLNELSDKYAPLSDDRLDDERLQQWARRKAWESGGRYNAVEIYRASRVELRDVRDSDGVDDLYLSETAQRDGIENWVRKQMYNDQGAVGLAYAANRAEGTEFLAMFGFDGGAGKLRGRAMQGVESPEVTGRLKGVAPAGGSTYQERLDQTPVKGGEWAGQRGESVFTSHDSEVRKVLGETGIRYNNAYPDFSPTAAAEVSISGMTTSRPQNFQKADEQLAQQWGMSRKDVTQWRKQNGYTWHEVEDLKTMQLVPTIVNTKFGHMGGVGELKRIEANRRNSVR
jgi:hypothetical protein